MKIIKAIPLARGIFKETLSYFSSKDIPIGSIVTVQIRKKLIDALVVSSEDASLSKSEIRASSFSLKKIESLKTKSFFLPAFIRAAQETAEYFGVSTGAIIQALIPKHILTNLSPITTNSAKIKTKKVFEGGVANEVYTFQAGTEERIISYKSIIREEFARGSSVYYCLPSLLDINTVSEELSRGIKEYVFVIHSKLNKKEMEMVWRKILDEKHPILIISTGSFFGIPRKDIGMIIVDKESMANYKTFQRPYFDIRTFSEIFAKQSSTKLIFGDTFLRPETIWKTGQGKFIELNPLKFRIISTANQEIVDMKEYRKSGIKNSFSTISNSLEKIIEKNKLASENLFIFVARKGLAGITLCSDCGEVVKCEKCKAPVVLHKSAIKNKNNIFTCHRCGYSEDAEKNCIICGGWRLSSLGIGIEGVIEEIETKFPDVNIFKLDNDTIKTQKKASRLVEEFFTSPGSILIGTQMALTYINKNVDSAAIVGIDSLFSIPDFRIREKIFNILLSLRTITSKNFLIQTRMPDEKVFTESIKGNLLDFYNQEINERKKFNYPPFFILIKIIRTGKEKVVRKDIENLQKILTEYKPITYQSFSSVELPGKHTMNILIKISNEKWPYMTLIEILRSLPPVFTVQVDPIDLL